MVGAAVGQRAVGEDVDDVGVADLVDRAGLTCADAPPMTGGLMTSTQSPFGTDTLLPSMQVGRFRYRVDQCLLFGRECGEPAAAYYCRSSDPKFRGKVSFETEPWPWTVVQTTKQTCFGSQCVGFKSIFCRSDQPGTIGAGPIPPDIGPGRSGAQRFPNTKHALSILYAVDDSGNLQWYRHEAVEDGSSAKPDKFVVPGSAASWRHSSYQSSAWALKERTRRAATPAAPLPRPVPRVATL